MRRTAASDWPDALQVGVGEVGNAANSAEDSVWWLRPRILMLLLVLNMVPKG